MRAYFWGNMYLSSIQQGIQSAHCLGEMFVKYPKLSGTSGDTEFLNEWVTNHKTMILLNGGYSETLRNLLHFFCDRRNPYPFSSFNESEDALAGALTCVGIILPEKIYGAAAFARFGQLVDTKHPVLDEIMNTGQLVVPADENDSGQEVVWIYNSWEAKLIADLNNYSLAN